MHRLVLSLIFLFCQATCATISASNNATQNATESAINNTISSIEQYVGFVSDPSGRGTSTLLISCVVTLVLCVWSALHLNVPQQNQSKLSAFILSLRWIVTGIYAPELVVFTAWRQWSSSKILSSVVQDATGAKSKRTAALKHPCTMAHSFFACTGGFAFEIESLNGILHKDQTTESNRPIRLTLTARGVALLAKAEMLPDVTTEEIMDKSKANNLAKATVIIQAAWMLLQVIGRLATHLPVTLLEVNTVAHVLCAFAMYIFWWDKPLLPNEPIVMRDEKYISLAAFMFISSEMSGHVDPKHIQSQTLVKTLFASLSLYSRTPELEVLALNSPKHVDGDMNHSEITISNDEITTQTDDAAAEDSIECIKSQSTVIDFFETPETSSGTQRIFKRARQTCLDDLKARREKEAGTAFFERRPRVVQSEQPVSDEDTTAEITRWKLASDALYEYNDLLLSEDRIAYAHESADSTCIHLRPEQLVADHIQNWPWDDLLRNVNGLTVGMILWLANFCYGGIHLAAWNEHFPSTVECWMWRSSGLYIGFCGGLWVILNFLVARLPRLNDFWERWMDGEKKWWQSFGLGIVVFVCGFSLVLARIFIVVEAFISIRELPAGAYDTPEWTDIFPHL